MAHVGRSWLGRTTRRQDEISQRRNATRISLRAWHGGSVRRTLTVQWGAGTKFPALITTAVLLLWSVLLDRSKDVLNCKGS
jgi:hypothetical protein